MQTVTENSHHTNKPILPYVHMNWLFYRAWHHTWRYSRYIFFHPMDHRLYWSRWTVLLLAGRIKWHLSVLFRIWSPRTYRYHHRSTIFWAQINVFTIATLAIFDKGCRRPIFRLWLCSVSAVQVCDCIIYNLQSPMVIESSMSVVNHQICYVVMQFKRGRLKMLQWSHIWVAQVGRTKARATRRQCTSES